MENRKLKAAIIASYGTQADFSEALGTDESNVSRIIRGRKKLSRDEARRWAELLGCDPDLLRPVCGAN